MNTISNLGLGGKLSIKIRKAPIAPIGWRLLNALRVEFIKGWFAVNVILPLSRIFGLMTGYGMLSATVIKADGQRVNYGVLGYRVVTTAFVNFLTDQLQTESALIGDFKYHDSGVGATAENIANTSIETTDGEARVIGTQTEAAANAYYSVGTISYTTAKAITEHGLFNDPTAGTLLDRTVFAAINVANGDAIEFRYTLTLTAGG